MDNKDLIGLITSDVEELSLLVQGFSEMPVIPVSVLRLAQDKVRGLACRIEQLSVKDGVVCQELSQEKVVEAPVSDVQEELVPLEKEEEDECGTIIAPIEEESSAEDAPAEVEEEVVPTKKHTFSAKKSVESRFVHSLRKALSLNDRIRYRRCLFDGNDELMGQVIDELDKLASFESAVTYIEAKLDWSGKDAEVVDEFMSLLKNRFS